MKNSRRILAMLAMAVLTGACTVSSTEPPPMTGPSELSLSLAITANPEVLSLDGASQALITIEARDTNGQPAANIPLRVEIVADGQVVDYGTLSARTVVTGSNGRATVTYTAPPLVGNQIPRLEISVTPLGSGDAANQLPRFLSIRLVPPGVILPGGLAAVFTFAPESPVAHTDVLFNASQSRSGPGAAIINYHWSFGDGTTGTGITTAHRYPSGTYTATLTVTDSNGLTASSSQIIEVAAGTIPTALFVYSPTEPKATQTVFFNASQSTPGPGRRIVSYRWNFGDGATASGSTTTHAYAIDGTYVVVLRVTDDVGQVGTSSAEVTVCPAAGCDD